MVQSTTSDTFFLVRLVLGICHIDRWFTRDSIVDKTSALATHDAIASMSGSEEDSGKVQGSAKYELTRP